MPELISGEDVQSVCQEALQSPTGGAARSPIGLALQKQPAIVSATSLKDFPTARHRLWHNGCRMTRHAPAFPGKRQSSPGRHIIEFKNNPIRWSGLQCPMADRDGGYLVEW